MRLWSRSFSSVVLASLACLSSCSNGSDTPADPVGQVCLQCLTERTSKGCATQYAACEEHTSCEEYALCQLSGRCFERKAGSGCEEEISCEEPSMERPGDGGPDAGAEKAPRELAADFEECARSTCAATCGFVP